MNQLDAFIQVKDGHFQKNGEAYRFIGTNFWSALNLATEQPDRLIRELNDLQSIGIDNLRIMALTEGPPTEPLRVIPAIQQQPAKLNENYLKGLDFLLDELAKRKMHAVLCLNNFWPWSGGMAQYIAWQSGSDIPYPPPFKGGEWWKYQLFTSTFYNNEQAVAIYHQAIEQLISRTNTINGIAYRDDPSIMAWQLANEPRASMHRKSFLKWIDQTAKLIKSLDANHLVSLGSEGDTTHPKINGVNVLEDHQSTYIDYVTIHCWVQNWTWYDPTNPKSYSKAKQKLIAYLESQLNKVVQLKKPLVLEEFGIARDGGSHDPQATTTIRDRFFTEVFEQMIELMQEGKLIAGANFWAWAGEGRPRKPHAIWKLGDDLTGDPPHEHQGWYSVYDQDTSTLAIIQKYCSKLHKLMV